MFARTRIFESKNAQKCLFVCVHWRGMNMLRHTRSCSPNRMLLYPSTSKMGWVYERNSGGHDKVGFSFHEYQHEPFSGLFSDCFPLLSLIYDFKGTGHSCHCSFIVSGQTTLMAAFKSRFRCIRLLSPHFMHRQALWCKLRSPGWSSLDTAQMRPSPRWYFVVVRCSYMSTTVPRSSAALFFENASFIAQYMLLTGTGGFPVCSPSFPRPILHPVIAGFSEWSSQRVRCPLHTQAHTVLFDRRFVERDIVDDGASTGSKIHAEDQVEIFRSVSASFQRTDDAFSFASDLRDD